MEDTHWCSPRGKNVPVTECYNACPDEYSKSVCWMNQIASEPDPRLTVLRKVEERLRLAHTGPERDTAHLEWERNTSLVLSGSVHVAFDEGYYAGLRAAVRALDGIRNPILLGDNNGNDTDGQVSAEGSAVAGVRE